MVSKDSFGGTEVKSMDTGNSSSEEFRQGSCLEIEGEALDTSEVIGDDSEGTEVCIAEYCLDVFSIDSSGETEAESLETLGSIVGVLLLETKEEAIIPV